MNHYPPRIGPPAGAPSQRLNELLDQIRAEFETESNRSVDYEGQSESTRTYSCHPIYHHVRARVIAFQLCV